MAGWGGAWSCAASWEFERKGRVDGEDGPYSVLLQPGEDSEVLINWLRGAEEGSLAVGSSVCWASRHNDERGVVVFPSGTT